MSGPLIAATDGLTLAFDSVIIKSDTSRKPVNLNTAGATCATYNGDGDAFIGTQSGSVEKYNNIEQQVVSIFASNDPIVSLLVKDTTTLVVGTKGNVACVSIPNGETIGESTPVEGAIQSLCLSNDKDLLSIVTQDSVQIKNLSTDNTFTLGLGQSPTNFTLSQFHPRKPSTLVVASDIQIFVFDTQKPDSPIKIIPLGTKQKVVGLIFIPNSKCPLAVALQEGDVHLLDLEKEKPLIRKIEFKRRLCSLDVSGDGTWILVGTEDGSILMQDIRLPGRSIRSLPIQPGKAVRMIASQKITGPSSGTTTDKTNTATNKAGREQTTVSRAITNNVTTRTTRALSGASATLKKEPANGSNGTVLTAGSTLRGKRIEEALASPKPAAKPLDTASTEKFSQTRKGGSPTSRITKPGSPRPISRRTSTGTSAGSPALSSHSATRTVPLRKVRVSFDKLPYTPSKSPADSKATTERSPSPDLPTAEDMSAVFQQPVDIPPILPSDAEDDNSTTMEPFSTPATKLGNTPDISVANTANTTNTTNTKGHRKTGSITTSAINKANRSNHLSPTTPSKSKGPHDRLKAGTMQLSPRRSPAMPPLSQVNAQELLRNMIREVMFEQQEEVKEELRGMHLDLVKMGRTWKNDLRSLMEEYVGDFKALRLENEILRAENDRLRRGY
ncbi:WD40 repeat-like protein [Serendipita vermifera]|nr:WD40 repeat-like protein [Serendipita vermifera]